MIQELNLQLSKDISWKSWIMRHQKLPMGERQLSWGEEESLVQM